MDDLKEVISEARDRAERTFHMGRWEEALEAYEEILALDENDIETRAQAGRCRLMLGHYREAAADLEAAIAKAESPETIWWVELGQSYLSLDNEDKAAANFQKALEQDPHCAGALAGMGLLYLRRRAYQMATTTLERAVALGPLDPNIAPARNNLAIAYCYLGNYEKALEQLHAARNLGYSVDPSFREMVERMLIEGGQIKEE
jgi:tetratricopeptide (TPR) repeat protein